MTENPFASIYKKVTSLTKTGGPLPEFPLLVDVEITSCCNLKCLMCEHTYMRRKQEMMSGAVFQAIIDQCKDYRPGIRFLLFSEPFLHPKIVQFVRIIKQAGMLLHITTNGTVVTEEHLDQLLDLGLDSITFSLQGLTDEEYAFIRGGDYLQRITERLQYLNAKRGALPFVQVSTTRSRRDEGKDENAFKSRWAQYADLVTVGKTSWSRVSKMEPRLENIPGIKHEGGGKHVPCYDIVTKMCVLANGDLTVCCDDAEGKMVLGNVLRDDMYALWHSDMYVGLRTILGNMKMGLLEVCKDCYPAYEF